MESAVSNRRPRKTESEDASEMRPEDDYKGTASATAGSPGSGRSCIVVPGGRLALRRLDPITVGDPK
jgi:hypothetical protein